MNLEKIEQIRWKVVQVIEQYNQLDKDHIELLQENNSLKVKIEQQQEYIKELESKNNLLTPFIKGEGELAENEARNVSTEQKDLSAIKQKIDTYIVEIDKCIEMLNNKQLSLNIEQ